MMKIKLGTISFLVATVMAINPQALARGVATIVSPEGASSEYDIDIVSTEDELYLIYRDEEDDEVSDVAFFQKGECEIEENLQVCTSAEVSLIGFGVTEVLTVDEMLLYTNTTTGGIPIPDSAITMGPETVLLELLIADGTYVTVLGQIDSDDPADVPTDFTSEL